MGRGILMSASLNSKQEKASREVDLENIHLSLFPGVQILSLSLLFCCCCCCRSTLKWSHSYINLPWIIYQRLLKHQVLTSILLNWFHRMLLSLYTCCKTSAIISYWSGWVSAQMRAWGCYLLLWSRGLSSESLYSPARRAVAIGVKFSAPMMDAAWEGGLPFQSNPTMLFKWQFG